MPLAKVWAKPRRGQNPKYPKVSESTLKPSSALGGHGRSKYDPTTCWQYSFLIFQYKLLVYLKCYILIQTPLQLNICLWRYKQFLKFKNNVKHKNLSLIQDCNSKSIFRTSDSFSLIMSHIRNKLLALTR